MDNVTIGIIIVVVLVVGGLLLNRHKESITKVFGGSKRNTKVK